MSAPAIAQWGEAVRHTAWAQHPRLIESDPQHPLDPATLAEVQLAYLSVDLMGALAKTGEDPGLAHFFATLEAAPNLRWLHICSSGTDRPLFRRLAARGVAITHSSGANAKAVAHTAMAAVLGMARQVPWWFAAQEAKAWRPMRGAAMPADLDGTTAVIVGLGAIGRQIARQCKACDMRVWGVRRQAQAMAECDEVFSVSALDTLLPHTDWLILACPLTPETQGLIHQERVALLPARARLINVSRGEVVHEPAVLAALQEGRLAGVYSDVFEEEPLPPDSPWWRAPNAWVSAHSAGVSLGFGERTAQRFLANLERWLRHEPLRDQANFTRS